MNNKSSYNPKIFLHADEIKLSRQTEKLLDQASEVYNKNFDKKTWFGRCLFLSWYCSRATCKFCFRATRNHQKRFAKKYRRSMEGLLIEALFCRIFNWRIEFLTGGYDIYDFKELVETIRSIKLVYGEKIWINLGTFDESQLKQLKPYVKGICASIETANPKLHKKVCPDKPIKPFSDMLKQAKRLGFETSAAFIVGLGEKPEDIDHLFKFIHKHNLDRITVYALKPVAGTDFTTPPSTDEYLRWLARIRIKFPRLEIMAGTNLRRSEEAGYYMRAGANAITKYPASKQFATKKSKLIEKLIKSEKRDFISNLTKLPKIDWNKEIDKLNIKEHLKEKMKLKIDSYLKGFKNPKDEDKFYKS
ncbi:MAG: radical SAM protein [Candidatus Woesearchaeota archaeon]